MIFSFVLVLPFKKEDTYSRIKSQKIKRSKTLKIDSSSQIFYGKHKTLLLFVLTFIFIIWLYLADQEKNLEQA